MLPGHARKQQCKQARHSLCKAGQRKKESRNSMKIETKKPINKDAAPELFAALAKATFLLQKAWHDPSALQSKFAVKTGKEMAKALAKATEANQ